MPPRVLRELLFLSYWTSFALICRCPWRTMTCPFRVRVSFTPTMLSLSMLTFPPVASAFSRADFWAAVIGGGAFAGVGGSAARTSGMRPPNDSRAVQNGLQRDMRGGIIMGHA